MTTHRSRRKVVVRGVVQGVGFRPFVYTTAAELALSGQVSNDSSGVIIEIEGAPDDLNEFVRRLRASPPPLAVVESVEQETISLRGGTGFHIADTTRDGAGRTLASPDVALCADCARELADPADRRYRHPFINCTNCGPRFTIIASLPYDRPHTSMADFPMCARCAAEYADPANRRFHAQPIACPDCGPTLAYTGSGDPLTAARNLLRDGGILAVKGIGGYHLACDATNESAVAELRRRKRRGDKPFAIMVPNLDTARAIVEVDAAAAALLTSPARPIVLLPRGGVPRAAPATNTSRMSDNSRVVVNSQAAVDSRTAGALRGPADWRTTGDSRTASASQTVADWSTAGRVPTEFGPAAPPPAWPVPESIAQSAQRDPATPNNLAAADRPVHGKSEIRIGGSTGPVRHAPAVPDTQTVGSARLDEHGQVIPADSVTPDAPDSGARFAASAAIRDSAVASVGADQVWVTGDGVGVAAGSGAGGVVPTESMAPDDPDPGVRSAESGAPAAMRAGAVASVGADQVWVSGDGVGVAAGSGAGGVVPAESVAPGNPDLGVMIAYAPLHLLLFGLPGDPPGPQVLVMTSGNLGGEPICYDDDDARARLTGLADGWLSHNRRILVPCDDSVVRLVDGIELPVRRSRGYAPLPLALPIPLPPTLAVGADLKNTCAVADGRYAWLSQHIGDMDDLATLRAFDDAEHHLERLTGVEPIQIVADAHPGYRSTAWAQRNAGDRPVRLVQHHHAHIAAVMGERGLGAAATVLGIAFDGTGFGPDGAVWGGEVLAAGYKGFRRLAHLKYAPLAGGDVSVHRPYRMALAHLWAAGIEWSESIPSVRACPAAERAVLTHQFATGLGCVPTSSMGRLFDAVSSLAGVRQAVDYEAQAAIELEGLARGVSDDAGYRFAITTDEPALLDPAPVLAAVVADAAQGIPASVIGARFHDAVAHLILELAVAYSTPSTPVALSGGVFQNALLLSRARALLQDNGFQVISHRRLPPNDGGLAFGQLLAVSAG